MFFGDESMQSAQNIVSRIIDLDLRAESIREQAREEAARIKNDAVQEAEEQKRLLGIQTDSKVKQISIEAAKQRSQEISRVRDEYKQLVEGIKSVSPEKKDRALLVILSGLRGNSE
jgi:hypothetical protein